MKKKRGAGILLPISSLPSPYGIGTLGAEAYAFVDQLAEAKQSYWQVLPVGPTSFGDSPYQSFSAFAGFAGLRGRENYPFFCMKCSAHCLSCSTELTSTPLCTMVSCTLVGRVSKYCFMAGSCIALGWLDIIGSSFPMV